MQVQFVPVLLGLFLLASMIKVNTAQTTCHNNCYGEFSACFSQCDYKSCEDCVNSKESCLNGCGKKREFGSNWRRGYHTERKNGKQRSFSSSK
ncbi:hypothetical protein ABFA07_018915 [Porites harrisoni]